MREPQRYTLSRKVLAEYILATRAELERTRAIVQAAERVSACVSLTNPEQGRFTFGGDGGALIDLHTAVRAAREQEPTHDRR